MNCEHCHTTLKAWELMFCLACMCKLWGVTWNKVHKDNNIVGIPEERYSTKLFSRGGKLNTHN